MKVFYTAKSFSGQTKSGEAEVKNERDLATQLRGDGYILTSWKELEIEKKEKIEIKFLNKLFGVSLKDKLMLTRNLGVMVSSGVPLSRAIKNLSLQTKNKRLSKALDSIYSDLQAGASLADGMAKYPAIFNELFVNMVRIGETGGNLEEILDILATQLEKEHDLLSKVRGAMTYPAVIVVAMIGIGIIMLTYILPKLTKVFEDMEVELPRSTQMVISLSNALREHSFLLILGLALFLIFIKIIIQTTAGKKMVSFLTIHLPVISNIVIKVNCARFARIYSSLLRSGIPVVEALKIISRTLTNYYYKNAFAASAEKVQKGLPLSKIIAGNSAIFPILITQMVEVGEETGKTEAVLMKLAEFYEEEINRITKNMSSIIEPILMIFIGSAVGFFAVSMLQPMYSIMDNIK